MASEEKFTGGCHCGAVQFEVTGLPIWAVNRHCGNKVYKFEPLPAAFGGSGKTLDNDHHG